MTTAIYLDPEQTAQWEPFEGDRHDGYGISPFEVPREINVDGESLDREILSIEFEYIGGEPAGDREVFADHTPSFAILFAKRSRKILGLAFLQKRIDASDLPGIAERIQRLADQTSKRSPRFNYRMISSLLRSWSTITGPLEVSGD